MYQADSEHNLKHKANIAALDSKYAADISEFGIFIKFCCFIGCKRNLGSYCKTQSTKKQNPPTSRYVNWDRQYWKLVSVLFLNTMYLMVLSASASCSSVTVLWTINI